MSTEFKVKEVCALLGKPRVKQFNEDFETTMDVIKKSSNIETPALFKPKKLLGDYDVCAGEEGTPELTKKYLSMTPGQTNSNKINSIIDNYLKENTMNNKYTIDDGPKLKSFSEFPVNTNLDFDEITKKATTPAVITMDFRGTVIHTALLGDHENAPLSTATTVDMNSAKERAMKRMAQFVNSYHGNNQETIKTTEV